MGRMRHGLGLKGQMDTFWNAIRHKLDVSLDRHEQLAYENFDVDLSKVVDRIYGEYNAVAAELAKNERFKYGFHLYGRDKFTLCFPLPKLSTFRSIRSPSVADHGALATLNTEIRTRQGYFDHLHEFDEEVAKQADSGDVYHRGIAIRANYPKGVQRYHGAMPTPRFNFLFDSVSEAFYVTPSNLGDERLYAALLERVRSLYDLRITSEYLRSTMRAVRNYVNTFGQLKAAWPDVDRLSSMVRNDIVRRAVDNSRATRLPDALVQSAHSNGVSLSYLAGVLQEITNTIYAGELLGEPDPAPPADLPIARITNCESVLVTRDVCLVNGSS